MFDHWLRVGELLGSPIQPVTAGVSLDGLIRRQNALPNWRQRWCTRILKIEPFAAYLATQAPAICYVGLRADEPLREGGDYRAVPHVYQRYPMREWGWNLSDVHSYLEHRGVIIPKRTDCRKCFFQRLIEWYELWRDDKDGWYEACGHEHVTGYTFRSPERDTWPAALIELGWLFEQGKIPPDTRKRDKVAALQCRVCRL
jgi:hypothetical protein